MNNAKLVKILGLVATAVGMGLRSSLTGLTRRRWKKKSTNASMRSLPHLAMKKTRSPNKGSSSLSKRYV